MSAVVLVTGATGFIGSHVVAQLLAGDASVRVLVRRPESLPRSVRDRVQVWPGDVRDPVALSAAVRGAGTVLHLAACARAWSRDPTEFASINVGAVRALLAAAQAADVERLVHVSTVLTLPPFRAAAVARGTGPTLYEQTKKAGERLVEAYAGTGRHAVIVHPTRVYGPGPLTDANALTRIIALYLAGKFRLRLDDGDALADYVHAGDVAAGIRLAAVRGRPGAHYLLGGENASFRRFLDVVSRVAGSRRRVVALPPALAFAAAHAAELWGRLGGTVSVTREWVRVFLEDRRGDITPARRDLGYAPRSLEDGLRDTIDWLGGAGRAAA